MLQFLSLNICEFVYQFRRDYRGFRDVGFTCDVVACIMCDVYFNISNQRHRHLERIIFLRGPLSLQKTLGNLLWNFYRGSVRKTQIWQTQMALISQSLSRKHISLTPYGKTSPIWIELMMGLQKLIKCGEKKQRINY